jgi:hypothetical protein
MNNNNNNITGMFRDIKKIETVWERGANRIFQKFNFFY